PEKETRLQKALDEHFPGRGWVNIYFGSVDATDLEAYVTVRRAENGLFNITCRNVRKVKSGPQRVGILIKWGVANLAPHPDLALTLPMHTERAYVANETFEPETPGNQAALDFAYHTFCTFHDPSSHRVTLWFDYGK